MKLNKKLEIGINAVNVLKTREGSTRTTDLAGEIGTTVDFLKQVMRNLKQAGIVTVCRGPGGGYALNRENGPITALQVAKAVGRDFGAISFDQAPTSRLSKAIVEAFTNTMI
jgi:Rrf2 family protein